MRSLSPGEGHPLPPSPSRFLPPRLSGWCTSDVVHQCLLVCDEVSREREAGPSDPLLAAGIE